MKDYARFSVKEFLMDEDFQAWVLDPGGETDGFWQLWLDENPEKRADVEEARRILMKLKFTRWELPSEDVSKLWTQIKQVESRASKDQKSIKPKILLWYGAAAAMFIAGISSFFWNSPVSTIEYRTSFGETRSITLPDSSIVILNSNSVLRLSSSWEPTSTREVWLDGEAFFSVIHKSNDQPFKVKTGEDVAIEVLGTTFNVYHRGETKVVLNTGRIQLSLPTVQSDEKILMNPGELVQYNERKYVRRKVDPKMYTAWTHNNLVLERTTLREMLHLIKDNYGIEVEVKENLLDQTISGSMPVINSESLMAQIAKAFRLKLIKEDDRYYMRE